MPVATRGFEADLMDCMVAFLGKFFFRAQIPVRPWFIGNNGRTGKRHALSKLKHALAA